MKTPFEAAMNPQKKKTVTKTDKPDKLLLSVI